MTHEELSDIGDMTFEDMSEEEFGELEKLLRETSQDDWWAAPDGKIQEWQVISGSLPITQGNKYGEGFFFKGEDAVFCSVAHKTIPKMIAEIRRLRLEKS